MYSDVVFSASIHSSFGLTFCTITLESCFGLERIGGVGGWVRVWDQLYPMYFCNVALPMVLGSFRGVEVM